MNPIIRLPFILVCLLAATALQAERVSAQDLQSVPWGAGQVYSLDGDWQYVWGQLLQPDEMTDSVENFAAMRVPGLWSSADNGRPVFGHATFQVNLEVPPGKALFLYVPDMPSAFRLFANGKQVAKGGEVAEIPSLEVPYFGPSVIALPVSDGLIRLVLQISNYHYKEGGIWHSFKIADGSGLFYLQSQPMILTVSLAMVLITIALYHFSVYWMRRQEKVALWFALFCLLIALRTLLVGDRVIYSWLPIDWRVGQVLEHVLMYGALPAFAAYYRELFQQPGARFLSLIAMTAAVAFSLITLVTPVHIFTLLAFPFQMLILLTLAYVLFSYVAVYRTRIAGSRLFGTSLLVMTITVVSDFLAANFLVQAPPLVHLGSLAFVVFQAIILNRRYVKSLAMVETMSEELKQRNAELERMDAFKDEFLATTSHELRTPLHGIAGLAANLLEHQSSAMNGIQRQHVALIEATSKRLGALVNDIQDFAALKYERIALDIRPVDVKAACHLVISTMEPLIDGRELVLSAEFDETGEWVKADENRCQQILFNLVGNAVKFTHEGYIHLRTRVKGDFLIFEIEDSGIGITRESQDALFEPFGKHSESSYEGSGLGLSICRQLVEMQGGKLELESIPDVGTTVRFTLPLASARDSLKSAYGGQQLVVKSKEGPVPVEPSEGRGLVYVVDDEQVNRQLLREVLVAQGYRVVLFSGAGSFFEHLEGEAPDLVILDLMMPGMNGFEVCERLRKQFSQNELPVIMLTARHQVTDIVRALSLGANDYLLKPYHERELIARVASQMGALQGYRAMLEVDALSREIHRRKQVEESLWTANERLVAMLDHSGEGVALVSADGRVIYANQELNKLLVEAHQTLVGESLGALLESTVINDVMAMLNEEQRSTDQTAAEIHKQVFKGALSCQPRGQLSVTRILEDGAPYLVLVFSADGSAPDTVALFEQIRDELQSHRHRLDDLESNISFNRRPADMTNSDAAEELAVSTMTDVAEEVPDVRRDLVELLRMSLHLWERHSGQGKVELAEGSRCWRVYVDGSSVKTRTLDKYLSLKTLPERPRWRLVIRTANFVISHCPLTESERSEITRLMRQVEQSLA